MANFLETNFKRLMETAKIVPAVNQIETHVFRQQRPMVKLLKAYGTVHESWSLERMKENMDIWEFSLSEEEMSDIGKLDKGKSPFGWW
nr:hypothetical protein [Megasphaera elsdenii]